MEIIEFQTILTIQVKTASQLGIPFLATGGGHGLPTTLHNLQDGISIDLWNFKNVTVDTAAQTATIGGGNVFSEIYDPIWDVGFELRKSTKQYLLQLRILTPLGDCQQRDPALVPA